MAQPFSIGLKQATDAAQGARVPDRQAEEAGFVANLPAGRLDRKATVALPAQQPNPLEPAA